VRDRDGAVAQLRFRRRPFRIVDRATAFGPTQPFVLRGPPAKDSSAGSRRASTRQVPLKCGGRRCPAVAVRLLRHRHLLGSSSHRRLVGEGDTCLRHARRPRD
jgi:hypothetical protein